MFRRIGLITPAWLGHNATQDCSAVIGDDWELGGGWEAPPDVTGECEGSGLYRMLPGESGDAVNTSNTITAGLEYEITVTVNIITAPITADGMELHFGGCTFNFTTSGTFTVYCTATVSGELYWTHDPTDTTLEACVGVTACLALP